MSRITFLLLISIIVGISPCCGKKGIGIPEGRKVYFIAVHGDQIAYVFGDSKDAPWNKRLFIDYGGKVRGPYLMVRSLRWSDDGKRVIYEAGTKEGRFSFNGDRKEGPYNSDSSISWSPDGLTLVRCSNEYVYVNGKKIGPFERSGDAVWSPDGKSFIMQALPDDGYPTDPRVLIIDGKQYPIGGFIESWGSDPQFIWSRTRRAFVYVKKVNDEKFVPCAGAEEIASSDGAPMYLAAWSPDGERLAYVTRGDSSEEKNSTLVVDGVEIEKFVHVIAFYWSPDSKRYAVRTRRQDGDYLYIDGKSTGPFDAIAEFVWSSDSSKYAFIERSGKDDSYKVHNGALKAESFSYAFNLRLAGNDAKLFFIGRVGQKWYVYSGKEKYGPFPDYEGIDVSISPDGMHFAVLTRVQGETTIVSDSGTFGPYQTCYIDEWSAKGGMFSYEYEKDGRLCRAVSGKKAREIPRYYSSSAKRSNVYDSSGDPLTIFTRGRERVGIRQNDKMVYVNDGYIVTEYGLD